MFGGGGRGRRVVREPSGFAAHLGERQTEPSELDRDGHEEVSGGPQLFEVLVEEAVVTVVLGCPAGAPVEDVLSQYIGVRDDGHDRILSFTGEAMLTAS